jgi:FKBP-type peptidyl-prolyl cis-trans isomerase SlyD
MSNKVYGVEYTVKKQNGDVVDTNVGGAPLEFISGKKQMIPGFEKAVTEMSVGAEKEVLVPSAEAYGEYNEELTQVVPKEQFEGIELEKGMTLYGQGPDGQTIAVIVKDFNDNGVTIDYNHPLAGEDLTFNIKLLSERDATADEVLSGYVGGEASSCGCGTGECSTDNHNHSHNDDGCGCGTGCGCH